MAVLVEKRLRVVEDADVAAGRPLRSGPRVMPRRPATKPRPVAVPSSPRWIEAEDSPPKLNQKPTATPRP